MFHKPDIIFLAFIETGDEVLFKEIVEDYKKGKLKEKINKSDFHKKQLDKVKISFIETNELSSQNFSKQTLDFLKKVGDFEEFINAFVNLTKGKTYGR